MYVPQLWSQDDYNSPTARTAMRTAIHNIGYAVANSNAMQGFAPGAVSATRMAPWQIGLIGVDAMICLLVAGGVLWIVMRAKKEKAHPELYERKIKKTTAHR